MKQVSIFAFLLLVGFSAAQAKPPRVPALSPIYINNDPVVPPALAPVVDALAFVNRSLFVVSNDYLFVPFPPLLPVPYEAQAVRFWTNSGTMVGMPGFNFETIIDTQYLTKRERRRRGATLPRPALSFLNEGEITVASALSINAHHIQNPGVLNGDVAARFKIMATNGLADLSRGAIRVGEQPLIACGFPTNFNPFFSFFPFFGDPSVNVEYFASGQNGDYGGTNGPPLQLDFASAGTNIFGTNAVFTNFFFGANFTLPNPRPPAFEAPIAFPTVSGFPATNVVTNTFTTLQNCGDYGAFVRHSTNFFGGRNVDVVFVPTNSLQASNVSVDVRFFDDNFFFFGGRAIVEFRNSYFDVIEQRVVTNYVTFDETGFFGSSIFNSFFFFNTPALRGRSCEFDLGFPANGVLTPDLFYNPNFATAAVNYQYQASLVRIANTNSVFFTNQFNDPFDPFNPFSFFSLPALGENPAMSDPTNYVGRVEIIAKDLDLTQARIRAENAISIRATNLVGNRMSYIDAPFVSFDVGTTNTSLIISNLVQREVNRMEATFNSWSGDWTVFETNAVFTNIVNTGTNVVTNIVAITEPVNYHVLILGACVSPMHPSILHRFVVRGTNLVIEDNLAVNNSFSLQGESLTIGRHGSLMLPIGSSVAYTNIRGFLSFTNDGTVIVPRGAYFGSFDTGYVQPPKRVPRKKRKQTRLDEPQPYRNWVNHGTFLANSVHVSANHFENVGRALFPATIVATNGAIIFDAATFVVDNASVVAHGDIQITAGDVSIAHALLDAGDTNRFGQLFPGALIIDATNSLGDLGLSSSNLFVVTAGMRILRRPENAGDFSGSTLHSRAGVSLESMHVWAGEDRGPSADGFVNNLALGRLILDGQFGNRFRFKGAAPNSALYVDYLDLRNAATDYNFAVGVDPGFTIYFADANVPPDKLDSISGGRLRWVSSFTGPQSSTNLTYPNGTTYTFNAGLIRSRDIDSDADGIVNAQDCTPVPVPGFDTTGAQCQGGGIPPVPAVPLISATSTADVGLSIVLDGVSNEAVLRWVAPAGSINTVESSGSITGGNWQVLTNFVMGSVTTPVSVRDNVDAPVRIYRVRVESGN